MKAADSITTIQPWNARAILLVDLDAFFASVEQLDHPAWRGKPVIVGGNADAHGVVSTCSYEARRFGVRSAMAASLAKELCPQAKWTCGNFARYREVSNAAMDIMLDETPHVQQVSIDEAFVDVTPTTINTENPVLIAQRIQERIENLGITCSIGVGTTKAVAKIASDIDKPRGLTVVYPGSEKSFLDPLPVRALSGVGAAAESILAEFGIRTLGEMACADESILHKAFGKNAEMMRSRAQGRDTSEVIVDDTVKSVSCETTFAQDLKTRTDIEAAIATLAAKVARRSRRKNLKGHTLTLRMRYDNRAIRSTQMQLPSPTDDEFIMQPYLYRLADQLWQDGMKVRLIGVGLTGFENNECVLQDTLFDTDEIIQNSLTSRAEPLITDAEKRRRLIHASDKLKDKYGEDALRFGSELRNVDNTTGSSAKNPADYK